MIKYLLSVSILLLTQNTLSAEVYTCTTNGKTIYQGKPCKGVGKTVGDRVRENKEAERHSIVPTYSASASTAQGSKYSDQDWKSICRSASKAASAVMRNRQLGISMNDQMDTLLPKAEPAIRGIMESMIRLAYTKPRFNTQEYKKSAETDFEDEYHLLCLRARE